LDKKSSQYPFTFMYQGSLLIFPQFNDNFLIQLKTLSDGIETVVDGIKTVVDGIKTVVDGVVGNLPIILGIGVIGYFTWRTWSSNNKGSRDAATRWRIRREIIRKHGPRLVNELERLIHLDGYATLSSEEQIRLYGIYHDIYDKCIDKMTEGAFSMLCTRYPKTYYQMNIGDRRFDEIVDWWSYNIIDNKVKVYVNYIIGGYQKALTRDYNYNDAETFLIFFERQLPGMLNRIVDGVTI